MPETLFTYLNLIALTGWIGLASASPMGPGSLRHNVLLICGRWIPVLLCVTYSVLLARYWGSAAGGGFQSLGAVQKLFSSPGVLLAGWTHYLAFDLFLGRWMVDDASSEGRSRVPLAAALPVTFLFGPVGVLVYLIGRSLFQSKVRDRNNV